MILGFFLFRMRQEVGKNFGEVVSVKLVSYQQAAAEAKNLWRVGLLVHDRIVDLQESIPGAPGTMQELLDAWSDWREPAARLAAQHISDLQASYPLAEIRLGAPLPRPQSFRDFYAFEAHVKNARAKRGLEMVPQWYHFPVFYFSNAGAIVGPQQEVAKPATTQWLDYELEIACIIGKGGIDIPVQQAEEHIAGFCILNDWSARDVQREEVKVGLGPAKGKDFATSMGPYLVTPDELADVRISGEKGSRYDLTMVARVNGVEYSRGNLRDIFFTFPEMIARASADCPLYPGDVIGSGTVGTGCILELGEDYPWLQPGDVVELEVDRLGILRNQIAEKEMQNRRER